MALVPAVPLGFVLGLALCDRLPLHVRRVVCSATFEGVHMVDDVTRARARTLASRGAGLFPLKCVFCCRAPLDFAMRAYAYRRMRCGAFRHVPAAIWASYLVFGGACPFGRQCSRLTPVVG